MYKGILGKPLAASWQKGRKTIFQ